MRATTRKAFIAYKKRFPNEAKNFFDELDKNVQKQLNEDEKVYFNNINIKVDDSMVKNNSLFNNNINNINSVKKAYSNQINSLYNINKKNSNNNIINNESITHKSSLNITPVKNKKQKVLYSSSIKQKFHEVKFNQKNYEQENIIKNKNNINKKGNQK